MSIKKDPIDWAIACTSDVEYNILLEMKAEGWLIKNVFEKSRTKLKRKGVDFKAGARDLDAISAFELDPRFYNVVKTFLRKTFNLIEKEVKADGIILLSYNVVSGIH